MSGTVEIKSTVKPRWYEFRLKISLWLVSLARSIYPENPDVKAFYMQLMTDQMIYGQHITRINPQEIYEVPQEK